MLVPFTAQRATSADNGIGDGILIGRCSMTFKESFDKDCMMNVDENLDDLKDYVGTTCILEP